MSICTHLFKVTSSCNLFKIEESNGRRVTRDITLISKLIARNFLDIYVSQTLLILKVVGGSE
jgi:hypothetical protein